MELQYTTEFFSQQMGERTKAAVKQGIRHAQTHNVELHVLHVINQSAVELTATPTIEGVSPEVVHGQLDEQGHRS